MRGLEHQQPEDLCPFLASMCELHVGHRKLTKAAGSEISGLFVSTHVTHYQTPRLWPGATLGTRIKHTARTRGTQFSLSRGGEMG